ncbi:MAG: DNA polymerase III subunit alpha [Enterobacteriaceae bacterium]|nr:DNA polymerase III subunit alpha [Enterobacteriaceae bacterium]
MLYKYFNIHVHSEYSFEYGILKIYDYIQFALKNNISVLSLTECSNMFSSVKFYNECLKFGIKPVLGCEVFVEDDIYIYSRVVLLCKNLIGYKNLIRLVSKSYLENISGNIPIVKKKWLVSLSNGLIAIGLSINSDIGRCLLDNNFFRASRLLKFWEGVFPSSYYLSVTRSNLDFENEYFCLLLDFLKKNSVFLVTTNEVCYLYKSDYYFYKSKVAVSNLDFSRGKEGVIEQKKIERDFSSNYFKFDKEMIYLFNDIPEVLENSVEISKRCNLVFNFDHGNLPKFHLKNNLLPGEYLTKLSLRGLIDRLDLNDICVRNIYLPRLKSELDVISHLNFINYFLITHDFINFAKNNDILVGPSRGSGGGSLVAYSLCITNIDPIKYSLLFERFLNKERLSSPDFDIDFCIEGRDFIMEYVFYIYNISSVAQIITFGSMTTKSVVRDVGRILGYPYGFVDRIAKLISNDINVSLNYEVENNYYLKIEYRQSHEVKTIIDLSLKLEGLVKNIGKHAGGIVISPSSLVNYIPLYYSHIDQLSVTQFDKDDLEKFGLIKFDFLGLKTLTIVDSIISCLNSYKNFIEDKLFNINFISLKDIGTYFLLQRSNTIGVFQLESKGIKNIVRRLLPESFEDIVALVALYRPGPLQSGMLDDFISRKLGREKINYIHFKLEAILKETYGVIVYQEQVMQIAQNLSGYNLASADLLRIAMSKKKSTEMSGHFTKFIDGALKNGVDLKTSENIFYLIEKFAGYGFNKSHSVGYALLSYQTAWLKSNYIIFFMTALLSSDMRDVGKLVFYIRECRNFGIKLYGPDLNRSFNCFSIRHQCGILYGFGAIKCLGESIVADIMENRSRYGYFRGFFDFLDRVDLKKFTKKVLNSLIYSGCFNNFFLSKLEMMDVVKKIFSFSKRFDYEKLKQISLFSNYDLKRKNIYIINDYFKIFDIRLEKQLLGEFISCNPVEFYKIDISSMRGLNILDFNRNFREMLFGFVLKIKFIKLFKLKFVLINIFNYRFKEEIIISYILYEKNRKLLKSDELVGFYCYIDNNKFYAFLVGSFRSFRVSFAKFLEITLNSNFISDILLSFISKNLCDDFSYGKCLLMFKSKRNNVCKQIFLDDNLCIYPSDYLLTSILRFKEVLDCKFVY